MMPRDPEALVLAADYWKAILRELGVLNALMLELSESVATSSIDLVHVATLVRTESDRAALSRLISGKRGTMALVGRLGEPLDAMLALATGRGKLITEEVDAIVEASDD